MKRSKPGNIDDYMSVFPPAVQKGLNQIRSTIKKLVPEAEETISYGIPAFNLDGKYLIYFAGYKNHISLYPAPRNEEAFKKELLQYKGGKGTVQFPLGKPVPLNLVRKIVRFRIKLNQEKIKAGAKSRIKNYIKYHNDGTIWAKGKMDGSQPTGYWEWFRKDGTLMRSGYFKDGKQTGEWTTYDRRGKVFKVTQMK